MRKWLRHSFGNRIFVSVLLVTLLPLFLCDVVMVRLLVIRNVQQLSEEARTDLNRVEGELNTLFADFETITGELSRSTVVHSALRRGGEDSKILYQVLFQNTRALREYVRFEIYDSGGTCRYTTAREAVPKTLPLWWGILRDAGQTEALVYRSLPQQGLTAARSIRRYDGGILGYIVIQMEQSGFDALLGGSYGEGSDLFLLDGAWRLIYCSRAGQARQEILRSRILAGETLTDACYYYPRSLENTGFTLILQQPKNFSGPVMRTIYLVGLSTGVLCLGLCLCCAWMLSRHLARPIHDLDEAMSQIKQGNYSVRLESSREDELGRLTESFNRMAAEYRQNLRRSVERQKELNEAQMRLMQAQLNPHFLYNTLDSMKWLGAAHHVPQVAALATDLAALLRAAIGGSELVTVARELELVERYLNIQYIRFEDRFTCEIDVEERFQSCIIPKLVLQPLVENAIIHGVADCEEGYIKVWAEQIGGDFVLRVSDNGSGMPEEMRRRLNSPDKRMDGGHLGLYNVDRIIRLHYGSPYGLSVESEAGQGCCVGLRLPMVREEKANAESFDR